MSQPSFLSRLSRGLTGARTFFANTLFVLLLLIFTVVLLSSSDSVVVPGNSALVINPRGVLVDQRTIRNPFDGLLSPGSIIREVELKSLVDALDRAATDDRITMAVLNLDQLQGASTGHAGTLGAALQRFSGNGKEVVAYGSSFGQAQYLIASYADAVYLHPMGQLLLQGFGGNQLYFSELLEKLDVNVHIFRVGRYKAFVEPYTRRDMSPEAREANQTLVDALWTHYEERIVSNRQLAPGQFHDYTQNFPEVLARAGNMATAALESLLVDELLTPDEIRVRVANTVGYNDTGDFNGIGFTKYLSATSGATTGGERMVGVITASGPITTGRSRGAIAADRVIELVRQARRNDDLAALVVRLNTPGGSAFASELIRQELELTQLAGKPVVISMGNVAASGGYWIASTADRIMAESTTITGSIGVFGIVPTFEKSLARLGVATDGVATTPLTGVDTLGGLSEQMTRILQTNVEHTYELFLNLVARGRQLEPERVDEIAQGRVWIGSKALELGLVDELGTLRDAVASAAALAQLEEYGVEYLSTPMSTRERLLHQLFDEQVFDEQLFDEQVEYSTVMPVMQAISVLRSALQQLNSFDDPSHSYALCERCVALTDGGWFW